MMKWIFSSGLLILPLLVGCNAQSSPAAAVAPAVIAQWSGQQGGAQVAGHRILRTADDWRAIWQQVGRDPPRALAVSRETGVVIFAGARSTGGYGVEVVSAGVKEGKFVVEYRETAPPPGAMTTQALTAPWAIALLLRSELPLVVQNLTPPSGGARPDLPSDPNRPGARQER